MKADVTVFPAPGETPAIGEIRPTGISLILSESHGTAALGLLTGSEGEQHDAIRYLKALAAVANAAAFRIEDGMEPDDLGGTYSEMAAKHMNDVLTVTEEATRR